MENQQRFNQSQLTFPKLPFILVSLGKEARNKDKKRHVEKIDAAVQLAVIRQSPTSLHHVTKDHQKN